MARKRSPKNHRTPFAVSYRRFSASPQARGDSIRRQSENAREWCDRNEVELDQSLTFTDAGKSAFRGGNAEVGRLGQILELIDQGRIYPGCYLVVESLDRLSRNILFDALRIMGQILAAGVRVVTLNPERIYDEKSAESQSDLLEMVLIFMRAREESATKSYRTSEALKKKRRRLKKSKLTSIAPAWVKSVKVDGEVTFEEIPERVEIMRQIFQLALDGLGATQICRRLNDAKTPTFGKAKSWQRGLISKYLKDRRVLGEFQPMQNDPATGRKAAIKAGDPVEGYYPEIIDADLFYQVQRVIEKRTAPRGKHAERVSFLFSGLCYDATRPDEPFRVVKNGSRRDGNRSISYLGNSNRKECADSDLADHITIRTELVERALLTLVEEIDLSDVRPHDKRGESKRNAQTLKRRRTLQGKLATLKERLDKSDDPSVTLLDAVERTEEQLKEVNADFQAMIARQASPADIAWANVKELLGKMRATKSADRRNEIRAKIAATIPQFVERVLVLTLILNESDRCAVIDVELTSGTRKQVYVFQRHYLSQDDALDIAVPEGILGRDLSTWKKWPKRLRQRVYDTPRGRDVEVHRLAEQGYTAKEIADRLGMTESRVSTIVIEMRERQG